MLNLIIVTIWFSNYWESDGKAEMLGNEM